MTDSALSALLTRADREALGQIYEAMKQPVYTVCLRILGNRENAEDICHEVFLKLFQQPPGSLHKPRAWIFQVARNLSIDALRSSRPSQPLEDGDEAREPDWITRMDLEAAVKQLPLLHRQILTLHIDAGLGFAQIAGITGHSLPSVYRKYRAALKQLRDILNGGWL